MVISDASDHSQKKKGPCLIKWKGKKKKKKKDSAGETLED